MTTQTKPRPKPFILPSFTKAKRTQDQFNGLMSQALHTMASDERVIEATPSLQRLREILRRPLP